jgi:hypothetical protein
MKQIAALALGIATNTAIFSWVAIGAKDDSIDIVCGMMSIHG